MTTPTQEFKELHELCEALLEQRLSAQQLHRLEQMVLADPAAKQFYAAYLHQHASLCWSAGDISDLASVVLARGMDAPASGGPATSCSTRPQDLAIRSAVWKRQGQRRLMTALLATAAGLVVCWLVWRSPWPNNTPAFAQLAECKGCRWDAGSLPTELGARLSAGRLRLAEGLARLMFDNGVEVTLESPAELELLTLGKCVLRSGRLVAHVPPQAIGFTVDTPTATLTDYGTEFGVNVKDPRTAEVQVFNGLVEGRHHASGQVERMATGRNVRFADQAVAEFDPRTERPVGSLALAGNIAGPRVVQLSTAMGKGKDAYVQPQPAGQQSSELLLVKNTIPEQAHYFRKSYIGIDLTPLAEAEVTEGQLVLTFTSTGMGFASEVPDAVFTVYGMTDESLDHWDEATISWAQAPANRPGGSEVDMAKVVRLGQFTIPQGALSGTRHVSGQPLVDFLNRKTDRLATFILVRETRGSGRTDLVHGFAGKNHPSLPPPTLKVALRPRG